MAVNLIVGRLGSGKTLLLTFFGLYYKHIENKAIYGNLRLSFADGYIESLKELDVVKDAFIAIDDGYMTLNSREMKGNREALEILSRSRKRELEIFITTVRAKQIDLNVRYNCERIWVPKLVNSPVKKRPPLVLAATCYEYKPEEEKEKETFGKPLYFLMIHGALLKRVVNSYRTKEEIKTMV